MRRKKNQWIRAVWAPSWLHRAGRPWQRKTSSFCSSVAMPWRSSKAKPEMTQKLLAIHGKPILIFIYINEKLGTEFIFLFNCKEHADWHYTSIMTEFFYYVCPSRFLSFRLPNGQASLEPSSYYVTDILAISRPSWDCWSDPSSQFRCFLLLLFHASVFLYESSSCMTWSFF